MTPAMSPLRRCSEPSVAEICSSLCTSKFSGSEPKFSWLASVLALSRVKLPEIWARPSLITGAFIEGAETTSPSSTIANWFCGLGLLYSRCETSRKIAVPSLSNSMLTTQLLVVPPPGRASRPDVAESTRSEEHTSELQSRGHLVCRLLLEKQ